MSEFVKMALREQREVYYHQTLQKQIDKVCAFADSIGKRASFEDALTRIAYPQFFGRESRTLVYEDFAPQSFGFSVQVKVGDSWKFAMNGGVIFHAASQEWSVHT